MSITADEVVAEEKRLASAHGVDLDALTPEQLRAVRRGVLVKESPLSDAERAVVEALMALWIGGETPTGARVSEEAHCARSTASHVMRRLSERGVLTALRNGGTRRTLYIPTDLHEKAMAAEGGDT